MPRSWRGTSYPRSFAFFLLQQNITEVAEAFGYTIYSKLLQVSEETPAARVGGGVYLFLFSFGLWLFLCISSYLGQDAELLPLINDPLHRPFTMLWPTDAAFDALSEKRQKWLYHREHRDVLASYLKAHIIRDTKVNMTTNRFLPPEATRGATSCLWLCHSDLAQYFAAVERAAYSLS